MPSVVTIPGTPGEPDLEGNWLGEGKLGCVVAPPHPLMGGHLSNPVVQALAAGFTAAGLRCLLFNFRGVGESGGEASGDSADADHDFEAALRFAAAATTVVVGSGYSFGGATAIRSGARGAGVHVVAVAPPPSLLPHEGSLTGLELGLTVLVGERDPIASPEAVESQLGRLPGALLAVATGADHFFGGALGWITERARESAEELLRAR